MATKANALVAQSVVKASRLPLLIAAVSLCAALGVSLLSESIEQMASDNRGHLALLKLSFTADTALQVQLQSSAADNFAASPAGGEFALYRDLQLILAPAGGCTSSPDLGPAHAHEISPELRTQLARWIEKSSIVSVCLDRKQVSRAADYYAWIKRSVPGISGDYVLLRERMTTVLAEAAFIQVEAGSKDEARTTWVGARGYLGAESYDHFGNLVERVALTHRGAEEWLLAYDLSRGIGGEGARIYMALAYNADGKPQEALAAIRPLVEARSKDTRVWQQYGQALIGLSRNGEAEDALQEAVRLTPDDLQALNRLGVLYSATGRTAQAEEMFRRAVAADGGAGAYWVWEHLGDALLAEGKHTEAVEAYSSAVVAAPAGAALSARKKLEAARK